MSKFNRLKYSWSFLKNIFSFRKFLKDDRVNILSKVKTLGALALGIVYLISPIDLVPELFTGFVGGIDDALILGYFLKVINDEIERFKHLPKGNTNAQVYRPSYNDGNIIENVNYKIKDE